ncbi:ATP-binding cassette domain-containing protein [Desulfuromonas acetoxidans]|uniref:ATP-binding cassette domain-containing protein n=1 Tax=Desulfuromonas acetoxidans TaxID=891 RepID=UPI0029317B56|nr:ATP-binding cassette domain-containing protein [Desulfuromonas acetoxidans]
MTRDQLLNRPFAEVESQAAYLRDFFDSFALTLPAAEQSLADYIAALASEQLEDLGLDREAFCQALVSYVEGMEGLSSTQELVKSLTIKGGFNKQGDAENFELELKPGQVVCIVGPTGSGKSRLLADIEWVAQGDTPTGRQILINGAVPDPTWRFSTEHKLVAQLSQNMNFVMDLSVEEFIRIHAESRFVPDSATKVKKIIAQANELAGEPFDGDTPITSLSGGQSRALMIADTAILSQSPIVLIDEIENAGIDRKKALALLVREEKIVLMATHDPILALMGQRRLVIRHGGVARIIDTSDAERANLKQLEQLDQQLMALRHRIRQGDTLDVL